MKKAKHKLAVGLDYDEKADRAPSVSVKGDLMIADEIVRVAQRYGVPVVDNPTLARSLNALQLDEEIPENLFEAVAIVLNQIEGRLQRIKNPSKRRP